MRLANPSQDAVYADDARVLRVSPKAVLVEVAGESRWVPRACLHEDSEVEHEGDHGRVAVARWWAEREGFPRE